MTTIIVLWPSNTYGEQVQLRWVPLHLDVKGTAVVKAAAVSGKVLAWSPRKRRRSCRLPPLWTRAGGTHAKPGVCREWWLGCAA